MNEQNTPTQRTATKVVYIAGTGRSGTTLIGNATGSLPGTLSAGEVKLLLRRGVAERGHCGCRELVVECPVWGEALHRTFGGVPTPDEALALDAEISSLVRTRRAPWWLARRDSREVQSLAGVFASLLRNAAEISGCGVIVDSSKLPGWGALLDRSPELDVRVVHVVRDPRAVAWSWQRETASHQVAGYEEQMERFNPAKSALMWLESGTTVAGLWPGEGVRRVSVRYEDFVADPAGSLSRIAGFTGLDADLSFVRDDQLHLKTSHAVAGNPNRVRSGPVSLRRDDEWQERLRPRDRSLVSTLTFPRRSVYGY